MAMKFVRNASFPNSKCSFTTDRTLWKMQVREWAFAQVDLADPAAGIQVTSNNPNPVPDHRAAAAAIKASPVAGSALLNVRFFAKAPGFTFIHPFTSDPFIAAEGLRLQVEVVQRRAPNQAAISLTQLLGNTVAMNAPDAQAYQMNKTITFSSSSVNPGSIFNPVPSGTDHLVISSHGGVPGASGGAGDICLFVAGFKLETLRLDVGNAATAFGSLKGKMSANAVIWFGGCNIGMNVKFCQTAADASGCHVVAPVMVLPLQKFAAGVVDMLDGFAIPKVYGPQTGSAPPKLLPSDLCANQAAHKFAVPI